MPYHGYYYGIDMYYIVLVLPCVFFAFWAMRVVGIIAEYDPFHNGHAYHLKKAVEMTGAQAAEAVLRYNGVSGVRIEYVSGKLTDHFDPRSNVIRLSSAVYSSTSVASIGVAAHEAGHAVQYAIGYAPIKLRAAIIPLTQFGSMAAMPLLILGLILNTSTLVTIGIAAFGLSTLFQLVTLPVEFNASARAIATIDGAGLLDEDELPGAKKVLRAAALTYVAALLMSLLQLMRFVLIFIGRGGR